MKDFNICKNCINVQWCFEKSYQCTEQVLREANTFKVYNNDDWDNIIEEIINFSLNETEDELCQDIWYSSEYHTTPCDEDGNVIEL